MWVATSPSTGRGVPYDTSGRVEDAEGGNEHNLCTCNGYRTSSSVSVWLRNITLCQE